MKFLVPQAAVVTVVAVTVVFVAAQTTQSNDCGDDVRVDLHFLLDASDSVGYTDFRLMLRFLHRVANSLNVSRDAVHLGVTTFSDQANQEFWMNEHQTEVGVLAAIDNVDYTGGKRHTELGLEFVGQQAFTKLYGDRDGVANVLVVVTDGGSEEPFSTVSQADALRQLNMNILTIGVGDRVDKAELARIASDSRSVLTVSDFDGLDNIMGTFLQRICDAAANSTCNAPIDLDVTNGACLTIDYLPPCDREIDLALILEESDSDTDSLLERDFAEQVVGRFAISSTFTQVSLITHNTAQGQSRLQFCYNTHTNQRELIKTIQNLASSTSDNADNSTPFNKTGDVFDTLTQTSCGGRSTATFVMISVTHSNITVARVVAGISNLPKPEVSKLTSIKISDWAELPGNVNRISEMACDLAPPKVKPPTSCTSLQQSKSCMIKDSVNVTFGGSDQGDPYSAVNNIGNMCAGGKANVSTTKCSDCPSGAPGGSVCVTNWVLDYILRLAKSGTVSINHVTGGCEECDSPHYTGHAVDIAALARHDEFVSVCIDMGGFPTDKTTHVMCAFN